MRRPQFTLNTLFIVTTLVAIFLVPIGWLVAWYVDLTDRFRYFYDVEVRQAMKDGREPPWPAGNEGKEWRHWPPDRRATSEAPPSGTP